SVTVAHAGRLAAQVKCRAGLPGGDEIESVLREPVPGLDAAAAFDLLQAPIELPQQVAPPLDADTRQVAAQTQAVDGVVRGGRIADEARRLPRPAQEAGRLSRRASSAI